MKKFAKTVRMFTLNHFCPWGIKATDLLRRKGFEIEDQHLGSKEENLAFKKENEVSETPQIWIEGTLIEPIS
ncbi:MAG: glutaredoxin domain-containing protein [Akkermansiaceae bacterium]